MKSSHKGQDDLWKENKDKPCTKKYSIMTAQQTMTFSPQE